MTLVLWLIINDGFSFDSSITCSEFFWVSWVNLGYIAGDRRQNLKPKFAQVPEQSDFTYGVYLVAAGWPLQDIRLFIRGVCTSRSDSWHSTPPLWHPLPLYFAINIARYLVSPRPPCVAIQHIILAMAISCKGQAAGHLEGAARRGWATKLLRTTNRIESNNSKPHWRSSNPILASLTGAPRALLTLAMRSRPLYMYIYIYI